MEDVCCSQSELELKKLVFVGSKNEEIAHKLNNQHEIRLGKELRHFDREKTVFLKSFRAERKITLQKQEKVRNRLLELGCLKTANCSKTLRNGKMEEKATKVKFFLTEESRQTPKSLQESAKDKRRIQSAQEVRKTAKKKPMFFNET